MACESADAKPGMEVTGRRRYSTQPGSGEKLVLKNGSGASRSKKCYEANQVVKV